jgi:ketosteroid isomerase-like protein
VGAFEEVITEPEEFFERGDRVVVFVLMHLRPRGSSAVVDMRVGHLWTMRDGQAVRCEVFPERRDALEAADRSDQDSGG